MSVYSFNKILGASYLSGTTTTVKIINKAEPIKQELAAFAIGIFKNLNVCEFCDWVRKEFPEILDWEISIGFGGENAFGWEITPLSIGNMHDVKLSVSMWALASVSTSVIKAFS